MISKIRIRQMDLFNQHTLFTVKTQMLINYFHGDKATTFARKYLYHKRLLSFNNDMELIHKEAQQTRAKEWLSL